MARVSDLTSDITAKLENATEYDNHITTYINEQHRTLRDATMWKLTGKTITHIITGQTVAAFQSENDAYHYYDTYTRTLPDLTEQTYNIIDLDDELSKIDALVEAKEEADRQLSEKTEELEEVESWCDTFRKDAHTMYQLLKTMLTTEEFDEKVSDVLEYYEYDKDND